jgi:hypothetical protein
LDEEFILYSVYIDGKCRILRSCDESDNIPVHLLIKLVYVAALVVFVLRITCMYLTTDLIYSLESLVNMKIFWACRLLL